MIENKELQRTSQSYNPHPLRRALPMHYTWALSVQRGFLLLLEAMQEGDEVLLTRVLQERVLQ